MPATKNFPWTTVAVLGILVTGLVITSVVSNANTAELIPILAGLIPGILAAGYSERTNKDVRNGVVQDKAKEGTKQALAETGVTDVVASSASQSQAYMEALKTQTEALSALLNSKTTPKEGV